MTLTTERHAQREKSSCRRFQSPGALLPSLQSLWYRSIDTVLVSVLLILITVGKKGVEPFMLPFPALKLSVDGHTHHITPS